MSDEEDTSYLFDIENFRLKANDLVGKTITI